MPQYYSNWQINHDYHFGGFAKTKPELIQFIQQFKKQHTIELEPIYTGKMLYGLYDLIQQGLLNNKRIIALHTGGLQGNRGFNDDANHHDNHHNYESHNHYAHTNNHEGYNKACNNVVLNNNTAHNKANNKDKD